MEAVWSGRLAARCCWLHRLRGGWRTHGWRDGRAHHGVAALGDLVAAVALPPGEESRNVTDLTAETDVTNETEETDVPLVNIFI